MIHRFKFLLLIFGVASLVWAASEGIRPLLVNRVDESKRAAGIVVGGINPAGREVICYGKFDKERSEEVNGDTIFELGTTTEVFTSLLLADMVERGEVKPDTPVADLLPAKTRVPEREGKKITLLDLSMHLSGLPRMPENMTPKDYGNIYADYSPAKLFDFLAAYRLKRDIGEKYEYSNLGAGLLGYALARKAGKTYEELVRKRILEPLEMKDSGITLTAEQKKRLSPGHDPGLEPAENWDFDALAGCGALRTTANDMLKFLAANLELTDTPLKAALRRMRSVKHESSEPDLEVMMGWLRSRKYDTDIVWHSGNSAGYWSFVGFDAGNKLGMVVLSNTYLNVNDIGFHAIDQRWPITKLEPRPPHTEIKLDPKVLANYVGEYRINPSYSFTVTLEKGHLYAQVPTQPRFELFAEQEGVFFLKVIEATMTFEKDASGTITTMYLMQEGRTTRATKVK